MREFRLELRGGGGGWRNPCGAVRRDTGGWHDPELWGDQDGAGLDLEDPDQRDYPSERGRFPLYGGGSGGDVARYRAMQAVEGAWGRLRLPHEGGGY